MNSNSESYLNKKSNLAKIVMIIIISLLNSCTNNPFGYKKPNGTYNLFEDILIPNNNKLKVLLFLDSECPLSISYSQTINKLAKKFSACNNHNVDFLFFLTSNNSRKSILQIKNAYKESIECWHTSYVDEYLENQYQYPPFYLDFNHYITNMIKAETTPQCFLVDSLGKIIYSGAIDNWVVELGRKKQYINNHYLENAIIQYLNGEKIEVSQTKAIGCIIQK